MLNNNFYVDNLIKTINSLERLVALYKESKVRMSKGNFDLKYNTNVPQLRDEMIRDHNFVEHGSKTEKVLGYEYSPETDTSKVNVIK